MGSPLIWILFHAFLGFTFLIYSIFHLWLVYKDQTTLDILNLYFDNVKPVPLFERKTFRLSLLLIFGTENLWKAMIYPLLNVLPINGLEYEYEAMQGRMRNIRDNNDFLS